MSSRGCPLADLNVALPGALQLLYLPVEGVYCCCTTAGRCLFMPEYYLAVHRYSVASLSLNIIDSQLERDGFILP